MDGLSQKVLVSHVTPRYLRYPPPPELTTANLISDPQLSVSIFPPLPILRCQPVRMGMLWYSRVTGVGVSARGLVYSCHADPEEPDEPLKPAVVLVFLAWFEVQRRPQLSYNKEESLTTDLILPVERSIDQGGRISVHESGKGEPEEAFAGVSRAHPPSRLRRQLWQAKPSAPDPCRKSDEEPSWGRANSGSV